MFPTYNYKILSYTPVDGDTVNVTLDLGFDIALKQSCRIISVDAPEHTTKAGALVSQVVAHWLSTGGQLLCTSLKWDKYGGRFDGDIFNQQPRNALSTYLISNGLARPYNGGKKPPWKKTELAAIVTAAQAILNS